VTSALTPDGRASLEHSITAAGAWAGGANLALQAAGILDSINGMNLEQFVIDLEIWSYYERLGRSIEVDEDHLALELIAQQPSSHMGTQHTMKHFRREIHEPMFGKPQKPEDIREIKEMAAEQLARIEAKPQEIEPLDSATLKELKEYLIGGDDSLKSLINQHF
jgi:trimethylamine--corrinoid protein Co-methyltransferase